MAEGATTTTYIELSRIWVEVLGLEHVGPDDDFFSLGGDSLTAIHLTSLARTQFGMSEHDQEALLLALFDHSTLARFAHAVELIRVARIDDS